MVYTKKNPAPLILGVVFLLIAVTLQMGLQAGLVEYLDIGKKTAEMINTYYVAGIIGVLVGIWYLVGTHREGHLDYYLSTVGGVLFILVIAMIIRWYVDSWVAVMSKAMGPVMGDKHIHDVLGLNYVVLGILAGIIVVNVFKIPLWAENGIRMSRLGLKTGVILLGVKFHRGSALSIFTSDWRENFVALVCALLIAAGVYLFVA